MYIRTKAKVLTTKAVIIGLRLYKYVISPFFPIACRFHPTCSEYAIQSITKYGLGIGTIKSLKRICRCNPWNKGGYDPVN